MTQKNNPKSKIIILLKKHIQLIQNIQSIMLSVTDLFYTSIKIIEKNTDSEIKTDTKTFTF